MSEENKTITVLQDQYRFLRKYFGMLILLPAMIPVLNYADVIKMDLLCTDTAFSSRVISGFGAVMNVFLIAGLFYWREKFNSEGRGKNFLYSVILFLFSLLNCFLLLYWLSDDMQSGDPCRIGYLLQVSSFYVMALLSMTSSFLLLGLKEYYTSIKEGEK